jgi:hypothetical protein
MKSHKRLTGTGNSGACQPIALACDLLRGAGFAAAFWSKPWEIDHASGS